jgi:hypothetical protein
LVVAAPAEHIERVPEVDLRRRPVGRVAISWNQGQSDATIKSYRVLKGLRLVEALAARLKHVRLQDHIAPAVVNVVCRELAGRLCVLSCGAQVFELQRLDLAVRGRDLRLLALGGLDDRAGGDRGLPQEALGLIEVAGVDSGAGLFQERRGSRVVLLLLKRKLLSEGIQLVGAASDERDHLSEFEMMAARELHAHPGADRGQRLFGDMFLGCRTPHLRLHALPSDDRHAGVADLVRHGLGAGRQRLAAYDACHGNCDERPSHVSPSR